MDTFVLALLDHGGRPLSVEDMKAAPTQQSAAPTTQAKQAGQEDDPVEEEDLDDSVCCVCFNGDSVEGNEILFCEMCEVPIHLACESALLHSQLALVLRVCFRTVTA